jgi:hypothetical protein
VGIVEKPGARMEVDVTADVAARFLADELSISPSKRTVMHLRLDDIDLGTWQVMGVRTERESAGYERIIATLRPVWE